MKDAKSLADVKAANQDKPVLSLFSDGNMEVAWEGPENFLPRVISTNLLWSVNQVQNWIRMPRHWLR